MSTDVFSLYMRRYDNGGPGWAKASTPIRGGFDSVILREKDAADIRSDLTTFLGGRELYERVGRAYRRGYLFHGPPGTGKTSLIRALCVHAKCNAYVIDLGSLRDDEDFVGLLARIPDGRELCALVFEDIDCMRSDAVAVRTAAEPKAGRRATDVGRDPADEHPGVSMSAFLNAMDGLASDENRIVIMTTNHPERLDPAVLRSGRVDLALELSFCTALAVRRMFRAVDGRDLDAALRLLDAAHPALAPRAGVGALALDRERYDDETPIDGLSPAFVSTEVMRHRTDLARAAETVARKVVESLSRPAS